MSTTASVVCFLFFFFVLPRLHTFFFTLLVHLSTGMSMPHQFLLLRSSIFTNNHSNDQHITKKKKRENNSFLINYIELEDQSYTTTMRYIRTMISRCDGIPMNRRRREGKVCKICQSIVCAIIDRRDRKIEMQVSLCFNYVYSAFR